MHPKISVLLPTYNYARYLPVAIESVLSQSEPDFELIVSDDASSDDSAQIIRNYAAADSRIRCVLRTKNLGMVHNWNACLDLARGRYIKFVFGDDCLTRPDSLQRYCELLERHPAATLAASARLVIDHQSAPQRIWDDLRECRAFDGPTLAARCLWQNQNLIGEPSAVMFRREAADLRFDPAYRQLVDLDFWLKLLRRGTLAYEPAPLCAFRIHARQQTEANRSAGIGALETLHLVARHLPDMATQHMSSFARARVIHRTLHYSRKRNPRTDSIVSAEQLLERLLPRSSRAACWLAHRATRPAQNLKRKLLTLRQPAPLEETLRQWRPLPWAPAREVVFA
jgi:hypothetical protein